MRLIVITPQVTLPSEPQLVNGLLAGGLRTLHVRKPQASAPELAAYVQQVVPEHRRRLVLHAVSPVPECNGLAREHGLGGVHYPERLRPSACGRLEGLTSSAALHSLQDLDRDLGALDYVFLSPIFDSISKAGCGQRAVRTLPPSLCRRQRRVPLLLVPTGMQAPLTGRLYCSRFLAPATRS